MIYLQQNIAFIRVHSKLTYPEFAEKIDCTVGSLKSYIGKGVTPPLHVIIKIADAVGLSLDDLIRTELTTKNYYSRLNGSKKWKVKSTDINQSKIGSPILMLQEALRILKTQA